MAKRILPYRDYSEHDVVNLFSLDYIRNSYDVAGWFQMASGDLMQALFVSVSAGALPGEVSELRANLAMIFESYLALVSAVRILDSTDTPLNRYDRCSCCCWRRGLESHYVKPWLSTKMEKNALLQTKIGRSSRQFFLVKQFLF